MAQTRKKRHKKRSGSQSGSVKNTRSAKTRAVDRRDMPPTWKGAFGRAFFAAALFFALMLILFKSPTGNALMLAGIMLVIYTLISYQMDSVMYRRRMRQKAIAKAKHAAETRRK